MTPIAESKAKNCAVVGRQLHKTYHNGTKALRGLEFEVKSGDIFGLIGPDGAGKTTTLKILSGVMEPNSGEVLVFGKHPKKIPDQIGYVAQNSTLYPDLTVDENLSYEAGLHGVPTTIFFERKEYYLKRMGLYEFADRLAGQLSGGMKQKLSLCCALIHKPQLLLLDEPTTGLDPISRRDFWQMLAELREQGVTTIIATPSLGEAERCNYVALAYEGAVCQSGSPKELKEALNLRRLEIIVPNIEHAKNALSKAMNKRSINIIDIYTYGDKIDVLIDKSASTSDINSIFVAEQIIPDKVRMLSPSLENVFVMRLHGLGLKEYKILPSEEHRSKIRDDANREVMISAVNLSKSFESFQAVNKVNLEIHQGEIYGLLGANGAGKTTTIKMLCGLLQPESGQVTIAGQKVNLRDRKIRKQIGYMSQKFTLYGGLTVIQNLEFYASIYEISRQKRKEKINWVIESCGLRGMERFLVDKLPRGWKQRISFGASIIHNPKILFLDEPTAGVDPIVRRHLWALIRQLADSGTTVLVTTHFHDEAEYCNRIGFMVNSNLIVQGSPSEIKSKQLGKVFELQTVSTKLAYEVLKDCIESWRISIVGDTVHILMDNPQHELDTIKATLKNSNIDVLSLEQIPTSLEDAFVITVEQNKKVLL